MGGDAEFPADQDELFVATDPGGPAFIFGVPPVFSGEASELGLPTVLMVTLLCGVEALCGREKRLLGFFGVVDGFDSDLGVAASLLPSPDLNEPDLSSSSLTIFGWTFGLFAARSLASIWPRSSSSSRGRLATVGAEGEMNFGCALMRNSAFIDSGAFVTFARCAVGLIVFGTESLFLAAAS